MKLLIPLGLLGLLGLIALIVIYLLKPNYQQKVISSTYVWKLSLKYKKKRIPVSRLRNLLILLCQILIICCSALILAQPIIDRTTKTDYDEKIIIIDASADMFSEYNGQTRFERAVSAAGEEARTMLQGGGYVSVILAGNKAEYKVLRADKSSVGYVEEQLGALECTYGTADIDGAMKLAEDVLVQNTDAEVVLYSGTHYRNEGQNVTVKYVSEEDEWNAAILSAKAELVDNYYEFTIEVVCYGNGDRLLEVSCVLSDYNGRGELTDIPLPAARVETHNGEVMTIKYSTHLDDMVGDNVTYIHLDEGVYSFGQMFVSLGETDSIPRDNEYIVYGTVRPEINIYYYTKSENPFYTAVLKAFAEDKELKTKWRIDVVEARSGDIAREGYDFYLYESATPEILPQDGVVFLANPDASGDTGINLGMSVGIPNYEGDGASLAPGVEHEIMQYIEAGLFKVTQYTQVNMTEEELDALGYDVLMWYEGNPVFLVRNDPDVKIGIVTFGTKYSTFNVSFLFPMLMRCLFDYYFPTTFQSGVYEVYSDVEFTPRGTELNVTYNNEELTLVQTEENKWQLNLNAPGTYTVKQKLISGEPGEEKIYVTLPALESDVKRYEDVLTNPHVEKVDKFTYDDLLIYFAAALVALLFLERLLHVQEGL